ncbi:MAG: glucose 1-dehydrogenase [Pseudomonadota bacterium]
MGRVDGAVAIVTGGASGLGAATAKRLADEGARVLVTDVQAMAGNDVVANITDAGGDAAFFQHDVGEESAWEEAFGTASDRFGTPTILFNNAGVRPRTTRLEDLPLDEWEAHLRINLGGVFLGIKHGIRAMKAGGGAIVNTSSIYGIVGANMVGAYAAAKGGVRTLTKSAAAECCALGYDIRVNSVHPGFIETPMQQSVVEEYGERAVTHIRRVTPMKRIGEPNDIAEAVLYLVAESGKYVTGSELVVDGGMTAV